MTLAEASGPLKHRVESKLIAREKFPKIEQSEQAMIWNGKAVNRSSKRNPGRQTFWFELSPRLTALAQDHVQA